MKKLLHGSLPLLGRMSIGTESMENRSSHNLRRLVLSEGFIAMLVIHGVIPVGAAETRIFCGSNCGIASYDYCRFPFEMTKEVSIPK